MNDRYMEVPLAEELFTCHQGEMSSRHLAEGGSVYHTYMNTIVGHPSDADDRATLRLAFEQYLRRLREFTPVEGKPDLFWRFRIGMHIAIEPNGNKKRPLVQLRTRLVVPDCSLNYCQQCLRTEGEEHNKGCENIVGRRMLRG